MSGRLGRSGWGVLTALAIALAFAPAAQALDRIDFQTPGAPKTLAENLRASSVLLGAKAEGNTSAQDILAAARADYAKLLGTLYAAGYYSGVIHILIDGREAASIAPLDAPPQVRTVTVTVQPGPLFHFGTARIAPLAPGSTLPSGFATGQVAQSGMISGAVDAAISGWRDAGHAKAAPGTRRIIADHPKRRLNAEVTMVPGPKVTFGELVITGNSSVSARRIRQVAGFPTGKPFDPKEEQKAADRLRRAGAFSSVAFTEGKVQSPGDRMDVTAAIVDAKRHRIGFGAEIASLDGLTLSGFWLDRNFLKDAQRLRFDGEISGIGGQSGHADYATTLRFDRPGVVNPDSALYAQLTAKRLSETDYDETLGSVAVGLSRALSDHLTASAGIGFEYSRVSDATGITRFRDVNLPLGLVLDSRDDKLNAHRGVYVDALVKPFKGFGGTGSGAQVTLDARTYREVGKTITLAGRLQIGSVLGSAIAATPRDYLFYSGGGGTVRGQPYQSLGVYAISPTQRSGGRSFVGLSGEVRARFNSSWGGVAFYDAGYVGANSLPGSDGEWQAGAGLGLRYFTGIGPIRLDLAMPVTTSTKKGMQIYVGIGQAF